jgi:hypothetical protein
VDLSKKSTNEKMLPNDSNLTAEEVRKSPKSTVDELIEAGDIALSKTAANCGLTERGKKDQIRRNDGRRREMIFLVFSRGAINLYRQSR